MPSDLDKDRETRYSIKRANELHQSPVLSLDELNDRVNDALDKIVIEFEGYSVAHAKKDQDLLVLKCVNLKKHRWIDEPVDTGGRDHKRSQIGDDRPRKGSFNRICPRGRGSVCRLRFDAMLKRSFTKLPRVPAEIEDVSRRV